MPTISARITDRLSARVELACRQLGVAQTDVIARALELFSDTAEIHGWECRRVWMQGSTIVAIGENQPPALRGITGALARYDLVGPASFWANLERAQPVTDGGPT